jgi:hypothetical protein
MATFNKINSFVNNLAKGRHILGGSGHQLKIAFATSGTVAATDVTLANVTQPSSGYGYTSSGFNITTTTGKLSGGTFILVLASTIFTASGGSVGPFRYVVLFDTAASLGTGSANLLIGWWDYGSSITLADTETLTITMPGATSGTITLA